MNMTLEQAQQIIVQALGEFLDPNLPKVVIVNGPRAELRGVPDAQGKAIGQAWGLITEALKSRDGKMPIRMGRRQVRNAGAKKANESTLDTERTN